MDLYEKVGFNFVYHYNPFNKQHSCIDRTDYVNFWNGDKNVTKFGWTSGNTVEEAQIRMLQRQVGLPEDGVLTPEVEKAIEEWEG